MRRLIQRLTLAIVILLLGVLPSIAAPDLTQPGTVLMLRHAIAPGTGDPANFKLFECSTQRNLSEAGRKQAAAIGQALRNQGIDKARVFTSQWCRCRDTADLLKLGMVTDLPALNSFFRNYADRDATIKALKMFLDKQPADGPLIILVTHQVNVTEFTGLFPSMGEGVVFTLPLDLKTRPPQKVKF